MTEPEPAIVVPNAWQSLRSLTAARIALGRTGVSLPTSAQLEFQLAHARARDAVHLPLDTAQLAQDLKGLEPDQPEPIVLASAAGDRLTYLQRPDLGRRLDERSRETLAALQPNAAGYDLALVVVDGLSALAIAQNAAPFLRALTQRLAVEDWSLAPITVVTQGRVAVGDEVGERLGARAVAVLIGERPGLSSPDSMGLYLSWAPRVGLTDAQRNCISNVRPEGLAVTEAGYKLHWLLRESRRRQLTGVDLKDETGDALEASAADDIKPAALRNFLLA
ncbi:ethanolamine ammonia-lyase [Rhodoferax koreense]|uniref:Ethanolamine ammonia-lyase small subunit n=1 Tax=Rhodoferax koreensis TaxID=1842727 RepID=A0A1P8JSR2_9BURK|nr:ethanolamine ammonia-lyase subunit EutC [Rhodoferax koreense]APW36804.1 ethanolamine ammonia-lyase [Rhodoferax koreense]